MNLTQKTKPWYLSRTIIGGIIAGAAGVLGLTDADAAQITDMAVSAAAVIGGALSVYGRVKATREIEK